MREFFHGWRRKIGCVTLVMALVFVVGWIRNLVVMDVLLVPSGSHSMEHCVSVDHVFVWGRVRKAAANAVIPYPDFATDAPRSLDSFLEGANLRCNWRWCGFAAGELNVSSADRFNHTMWIIPYWSLVIPLTALSGYLILSKPRKQTRSTPDGGVGEPI